MASPTDVANMALGLLGERRIEDLEAPATESYANLLQRFYAPARDAVLSMTDWDFATGWCALSELTETPIAEWDYQYALPTEPVKALTMWELSDPDEEWVKAYDPISKQQVIYTDYTATTVAGRCTFQILDTGQWTPIAIQALAYKLAADTSTALTGQAQKWQVMMDGMRTWMAQATGKNSKSRFQTVKPSAGLTRIRT